MAFSHGSSAEIYLDGMDASPYLQEVSQEGEIDSAETSCLGTSAKTYVPGLSDASVSMSGFFDGNAVDDTLTFEYKIDSLYRVQTQATYIPGGDALGASCYLFKGIVTSNSISTSVDDIAGVELEMQGCNAMARGKVLSPGSTVTATGNGAEVDFTTVSTTNGFDAILHVLNVSGTSTPTLTVKIQGSATSGGTFADLGSFTAVTAKGSQFITVPGTIPRYLRATYTVDAGTTPSFDVHVALRRK